MNQYNRVLKQKDYIVQKHSQVLKKRKTAYNRAKTCHKTEVSELKSTWKRNVQDLKETYKTDMKTKEPEKIVLMVQQVNQLERDKMTKSFVLEKLQGTLSSKEGPPLSEVKTIYVATHCNMDGFTELNKS